MTNPKTVYQYGKSKIAPFPAFPPLGINQSVNEIIIMNAAEYEFYFEYLGNESAVLNVMIFDIERFNNWINSYKNNDTLLNKTIYLDRDHQVVEMKFSIEIPNFYVILIYNVGKFPFYGIIARRQVSFDYFRLKVAVIIGVLGTIFYISGFIRDKFLMRR